MWRLGRESLGTHSKDPTPQMIWSACVCVCTCICACDHACALTLKVYPTKKLQSECIVNVLKVKNTFESHLQTRWIR